MITIKNKIKKLKSLTLRFQINDGGGEGVLISKGIGNFCKI